MFGGADWSSRSSSLSPTTKAGNEIFFMEEISLKDACITPTPMNGENESTTASCRCTTWRVWEIMIQWVQFQAFVQENHGPLQRNQWNIPQFNTEMLGRKSQCVTGWAWKHSDFDRVCPKILPIHWSQHAVQVYGCIYSGKSTLVSASLHELMKSMWSSNLCGLLEQIPEVIL